MIEKDYPNNSKTNTNKVAPPVEKIVNGEVSIKKKTLGDKFKETFFSEDIGSVREYLIWDVLIPAAKDTLEDLTSYGVSMLLRGTTHRTKRTARHRGQDYVPQRTDYRNNAPSSHRKPEINNRALHNFEDIVINDRGEANLVLDRLVDRVDEYGVATVADFYDFLGKSTEYTDGNYGWDSIEALENFGATVDRVRGGYVIRLPRPKLLKRR